MTCDKCAKLMPIKVTNSGARVNDYRIMTIRTPRAKSLQADDIKLELCPGCYTKIIDDFVAASELGKTQIGRVLLELANNKRTAAAAAAEKR